MTTTSNRPGDIMIRHPLPDDALSLPPLPDSGDRLATALR
jgi:hypothetical protein